MAGLITGIMGEKYFCKDDIFRKTYCAVDVESLAELDKVLDV